MSRPCLHHLHRNVRWFPVLLALTCVVLGGRTARSADRRTTGGGTVPLENLLALLFYTARRGPAIPGCPGASSNQNPGCCDVSVHCVDSVRTCVGCSEAESGGGGLLDA